MCCGRGIKSSASRKYVSPNSLDKSMAKKKATARKLKHDGEVVKNKGAYYGNPVEKKSSKKAKAESKKEADTSGEKTE